MIPGKCIECGGSTAKFFVLKKGNKIKREVCQKCKKKLENKGWKVISSGMH